MSPIARFQSLPNVVSHLNVEPVLGLHDPAVEAVHVGGVGDAEYVLEESAPAEQEVLPLLPAEQRAPPSFGDGRVVEVLAEVVGHLGSWRWMMFEAQAQQRRYV